MEIHIITAFPGMFTSPLNESIIKRAQDRKLVTIQYHDLRNWTTDKHKTIDAKPYGGGAGMVLLLEPIYKAVKDIKKMLQGKNYKILLTSAKGEQFNQKLARDFSQLDALVVICGHYEGVDERVAKHLADQELSIGKYVLTGGELPAMVIIDAVTRLIPGVLGNESSLSVESFINGDETESPQYTRPEVFTTEEGEEWAVPKVLLSGHHKQIEEWRQQNSQNT